MWQDGITLLKKLGAKIVWEKIPKSKEHMRTYKKKNAEEYVLRGGDDYELMFTVSKNASLRFEKLVKNKKPSQVKRFSKTIRLFGQASSPIVVSNIAFTSPIF